MKLRIPKFPSAWIGGTIVIAILVVGLLTWSRWFPTVSRWVGGTVAFFREQSPPAPAKPVREEAGSHDHTPHAGHADETSLELSAQALRNVGLAPEHIRPIQLQDFRQSITVPAVIVERPGRTQVQVATPLTGVVTQVHAVQGEAVAPGTLLFKIRLTHEDLVQAQTDFLKTLGELDVEEREITRLTKITRSGAIAGKVLLERQYAKDRLLALLRAQREALRLHGLSEDQVQKIVSDRRLLRELLIHAPAVDDDGEVERLRLSRLPARRVAWSSQTTQRLPPSTSSPNPLIMQRLDVHKGQSVKAGETLCVLADYEELFIEGLAFERDISQLREASARGWSVDAVFEHPAAGFRVLEGLRIAYLANQIDTESRTLHFYVRLPNQISKDSRATDGNRFVEWRYLPGQRLQLRVPVEEWSEQIVFPIEAVVREGAEYFVFQQNGEHFDRVPVHVKHKDQFSVVIENDGSLFPGDVVAMRGAHQMQMALRNKAGGGVDPHAGHQH